MNRMIRWAALGLVLGMASVAMAAEKISVLIIDGQHNHNWQATTPAIKKILTDSGRFDVDVATTPTNKDPKDAWEKFRPEFGKYGVVLINYHGQEWPAEVNAAFEKYMENGGGMVFYHASLFSFPKWEAWNKAMALGWRDNKYGDRITVDNDGKIVRTPKGEGPGASHGPAHAFEMTVRQPDNPIMKGFPAKWMRTVKDEL